MVVGRSPAQVHSSWSSVQMRSAAVLKSFHTLLYVSFFFFV